VLEATEMKLISGTLYTRAPRAVILIRFMVGAVFLSEGIQKFPFPADLGVGRFVKIGIPSPGRWLHWSVGSKSGAGL
jgi:hypothetical protein